MLPWATASGSACGAWKSFPQAHHVALELEDELELECEELDEELEDE